LDTSLLAVGLRKDGWRHDAAMHPNERLLRNEYSARARRDDHSLSETFSEGIIWHVPGRSAISGVYRGRDEVMKYVQRRRELVQDTFEITVEDVLANDSHGLVIASGRATRKGRVYEWRAHGLYRFEGRTIAECWVFPEDQALFDEIWA
jgi:ketosteroid isomerase-like protein